MKAILMIINAQITLLNFRSEQFYSVGFSFLFTVVLTSPVRSAMTLAGNISASSVTVTGGVTVSSVTISSLTVTNLLQTTNTNLALHGNVVQMVNSPFTTFTEMLTSTTTFQAIAGSSASITLLDINDYVQVSFSGPIQAVVDPGSATANVTIMRGMQNLGNSYQGITGATGSILDGSASLSIVDYPHSTGPLVYEAYLNCTGSGSVNCGFGGGGEGYLLLEEIKP